MGTSTGRGQAPRRLFLFTKPAVPGRVKTRLVGDLTAEQAADLHRAFLADVSESLAVGAFELHLAWALEPEEEVPQRAIDGPRPGRRLPGRRQVGKDLGERLHGALRDGARDGAHVAAVGSDHPELRSATVERAFEALDQGADVVLGPSSDGGYYLIATTASALGPDLFREIPWSTPDVARQTLERCADLDLRVELLPEGHDVDLPADLEALAARLGKNPDGCPATRRRLADLGLLKEKHEGEGMKEKA